MAATAGAVGVRELRPVDPATLEVVGVVPALRPEDVSAVVAEAGAAQVRWARAGAASRAELLRGVLDALVEHADEIARSITAETGKPLLEAYATELFVAAENARWLADDGIAALHSSRLRPPLLLKHKRGRVVYQPLGVVAIVSPWNFPFSIAFTQAAAAVAAGNAALVKPAELTPLTGAWVERLFAEAGAPAGLVRVLQGEGESVGAALVRAPGVARVLFTGSAEVGREIAASAADLLRPVTLELGGKDPMLVFGDADCERAVAGAAWGSFANCGQICSGAERIYVEKPLYGWFVEALAGQARALRVGRGTEPDTDLGPLITESARSRVESLVADTLGHGAELVCGGRRPAVDLPGWFYEPTVLAGERIGGRIEGEEIFGPVVTVEPFSREDEAVRLANGSAFGLGASVWTRDSTRARRVALQVEAGSVWTNDLAYSYYFAQSPWGGCKGSGFGRTHGVTGLHELSRVKFVDADTGRVPVTWWFPYRQESRDGLRGTFRLLYARGLSAKGAALRAHRRDLAYLAGRYVGRS
jgi:acyl-CoA reductase-like NAD-dependent aldehyde dehydrogenase